MGILPYWVLAFQAGSCWRNPIPFRFPAFSFLLSIMVLCYFSTDELVDIFPRGTWFHLSDGTIDFLVLFIFLPCCFTLRPKFSTAY